MLPHNLPVEALCNIKRLGRNDWRGRYDHINGLLGHGRGESHSLAGSLVVQVGNDAIVVQLGSVRVGCCDIVPIGRSGWAAGATFTRDGALGDHYINYLCQ